MIFISAGHHPVKPGACYEDFCEHDEAVRWVGEILSYMGERAMVVPALTLKDKIQYINARAPSIAVEVHFNSAKVWKDLNKDGLVDEGEVKNVGSGALTLYCPGSIKGKRLAEDVQDAIEPLFKRHWNGVMEGWYRMDRKYGPDRFLTKTVCPAIIVEPEFIHRKEVIQSNREVACFNIAQALLDYK